MGCRYLGTNAYLMRYSGLFWLTRWIMGQPTPILFQKIFAVSTIAGQGFIYMAAMIFGKWNSISHVSHLLRFSSVLGRYRGFHSSY